MRQIKVAIASIIVNILSSFSMKFSHYNYNLSSNVHHLLCIPVTWQSYSFLAFFVF